MLNKKPKYSYNDISVIPCELSDVSSRTECNALDESGMLPIFTAPMTSVVGLENYEEFEKNHIYSILPRTVDIRTRLSHPKWCAYSLSEFKENYVDANDLPANRKVLIDIANGHMKSLCDLIKLARDKWGQNLQIMAGNIANPRTFLELAKAGVDYVRLGIGSGQGCITSSNTAIHFPMASLIDETAELKNSSIYKCSRRPKIVADGGIRGYSDVIKALALGADYVMIGGLLSETLESSGKLFDSVERPISKEEAEKLLEDGEAVLKKFYGMASREGQIDLLGKKTQTAEGVCKLLKVNYKLSQWTENMIDYLKSAMSYTGTRELYDFKRCANTIVMGGNTYNTINK